MTTAPNALVEEDDGFIVEPMENPRLELVRRLTDLVALPSGQLSPNDREFIADVLIATLEQVPEETRREAAQRLSTLPELPAPLLKILILDDPDIAVPLLNNVASIPEYLLVEACGRSPEHRSAIGFRKDLTSGVFDALAKNTDVPVLKRVLENHSVVLSEETLMRLVQRCQHETDLRDAVLKRPELRHEHGFAVFWWVDSAHRSLILSRFATDRSKLQEALQDMFRETFTTSNPDPVVLSMLKLIDRRHRPRGKNGEMVTMDVVHKTLEVARTQPSEELAHAVGLLAGVSSETASRILHDFSGEPFAILCKSVGLSRNDFYSLFDIAAQTTQPGDLVPEYDAAKSDQIQGVFDSISRDYARTILRYWDWRGKDIMTALEEVTPDSEEGAAAGYLGAV